MKSVLLIYTGGTIGMKQDAYSGALVPFNFEQLECEVPELKKFAFRIDTISFKPIDSSEVGTDTWVQIATTIASHYTCYDGFVVLHGTDTMAYTASALSFMLENLSKPVVLTGSQLPIGMIRTDGKENLISAIEIAAAQRIDGSACVPEVCIFFDSELMRGNRTTKYSANHFRAFRSDNYPPLASAGIRIEYNDKFIHRPNKKPLLLHTQLCSDVAVLHIFPGITEACVRNILSIDGLRAVVLMSYGSGNVLTAPWFVRLLRAAIARGIIVLNVSQCHSGGVNMSIYEGGRMLLRAGVVSGHDTTIEAAVTKLMYLLGKKINHKEIQLYLGTPLRGEITPALEQE